ncbi:MAG: His/Gly/Thr/Pro-type tRNA ligase C-terminal domain-containing protein [Patescibacteria group bacterium]|nr:His/Gly/Thr/Pro-type tRNA ligase C-terminal domain-containing protein [Patescibacteria group bacterium]
MLQSKLFTKTIKEAPKDEMSFNAQALIRAGFIDKLAAGIYSFLPLGLRVLDKISRVIREEMDAIGGEEILMPVLIPKENWAKTGRWETLDVLFKLKGEDEKEYALGATHEEVITPLCRKFLFSYRDLPIMPYQIQIKFRNELRAKAGIMRGREFLMKDMYSFHADQADLDRFYEVAKQAYFKIFERLGLGGITYLTYASGSSFSKYSHEFQTICAAGEDTIFICDNCRMAVNKEIIKDQEQCPICGNKKFREEKAVEVGNIFKLANKYSQPFGLEYVNDKGEKKEVAMGCYGIGPSRVMGTVVEICHDERGIVWPKEIAPFKVHLLLLSNKSSWENNKKEADKLYQKMREQGIEVLYDEREEKGAGEKFSEADLIGCPIRIVVSDKTLAEGSAEVKKRNSADSKLVKIDNLVKELTQS